ncbi:MAG: ribosome biogenesis GTPase Der [Planctomycetota bacterium]|jgi:GTP-binding protein|nr:ribosome biogenesis GTPase Der [Planctomycetota bacterium]
MPATRYAVAIIGRPNVGKSTLFNRLAGSRIAIEAPLAGVTRDRVLYPLTINDRSFDLIDTGGIGIVDKQSLETLVEKQIAVAIAEAAVILFLVDSRDGLVPLDQTVAERLRQEKKGKVILVATKVDSPKMEDNLPSFHALGFGDAIPVSALGNRHVDEIEDAILTALPPPTPTEEPVSGLNLLKIAFVGRRNVGKSSIVNQLCGGERVIVSDTPGTTRDSVDVIIERGGEKFVAIDTAGLRKRGQMDDVMEFFGHLRSERAISRADAVVMMLDATAEISKVEKRLGDLIREEYKPCVIVLNKWDLAKAQRPDITLTGFQDYVAENLPGLHYCRLAAASAKTGENVWNLIKACRDLQAQASRETRTAAINQALAAAFKQRHPRAVGGKIGKIYYGNQVGTRPPTFLLFCNNPAVFDDSYRRYLENSFREALNYPDIPLKLIFKTQKEVGRYAGKEK